MKKITLLIAVLLLAFLGYANKNSRVSGFNLEWSHASTELVLNNWSDRSYEPHLKLQKYFEGQRNANLWNVLTSAFPRFQALFFDEVCEAPTGVNFDNLGAASVRINWLATISANAKYDVYYSTVSTVPTTGTIGQLSGLTALTTNITGLTSATTYFVWVRSSCTITTPGAGGAAPTTEIVKGPWTGSMSFTTLSTIPYTQGFEADNHGWEFGTGTHVNKWIVGTAAKTIGLRGLYISKDEGVSNLYNVSGSHITHASKKIIVPAATQEVSISFDWRCMGGGFVPNAALDYFKVWVMPEAFTPATGTMITAANGGILVRQREYNNNDVFLRENRVVNLNQFAGQTIKLVFEWRNDATDGIQPPAAIDNINIKPIICSAPTGLGTDRLTQNSVRVNWTAPIPAPLNYEIYYTTTQNPIIYDNQVATVTGITTTNSILTGLLPDTDYYIWVRSNCGLTGKSYWQGPLSIRTGQIPVPVEYQEGFEGASGWSFINDGVNKWVVGSAVNNGGTKSLYVSKNNGTTYEYELLGAQVSHAYRDFIVTPDMEYLHISFDWRIIGEGTTTTTKKDYFRVWLVPVDYLPTKGQAITALSSGGIQIGKEFYNDNNQFKKENLEVSLAGIGATSNKRIVFEWINDARTGNQPPAAIDNVAIKKLTCFAPTTFTHSQVENNSVRLAWNIPNVAPLNYEIYYGATATYPGTTAVPNHTEINNNRYEMEGLTPDTEYYIWVRSNCGPDNKSFWVGPIKIKTLKDPALLPYTEDFEGIINWELDSNQVNKWAVGNAVNNGGTRSLYISNDNGASNQYATNVNTVAHTFRDIQFTNSSEVNVSFDWRAIGEGTSDYLRVWLVPTTFVPIPGTAITELNSGGIRLGANMYNQNGAFTTVTFDADVHRYIRRVGRLVFEWVNNAANGTQPPAAIDNLNISELPCSKPYDVKARRLQGTNKVILDWEPGGNETRWEVIIQAEGGPVPTTGFLVEGDSKFLTDELVEGELFEYYVRAVCEGGTKSTWMGPMRFSIFNPPVCADVLVEDDITADLNENAKYVLCEGDQTNFSLKATTYQSQLTTSYEVAPIDYLPPFPFVGGTQMNITIDDTWSPKAELPFDFCFFGKTYNSVRVGSNGIVGFEVPDNAFGCAWDLNGLTIPNTAFPIRAAIYGVYQDLDPTRPSPNGEINYQVLGTYPCRVLVVSFNEMALYDADCQNMGLQTSQIVLYEISNIIEVYIQRRTACLQWPNPGPNTMPGQGVVGIQNAAGTVAYAPPGRNTGAWAATEEAWRFTPNGGPNSSFEWTKDGEFFSSEPEINIDVTEAVVYKAVGVYQKCDGEEYRVEQTYDFLKDENIDIDLKQTMLQCFNYKGEYIFDLKGNETTLLGDLDPAKYILTYHNNRAAAVNSDPTTIVDEITVTGEEYLYVRVEQKSTKCFKIVELRLAIEAKVTMTPVENHQACISFELPPLLDHEEYYTETNKGGTRLYPGDLITEPGLHKIFVFGQEEDCIDEKSFSVEITAAVYAQKFNDVNLKCENYTLEQLPEGNQYFTMSHLDDVDGGVELFPGSLIRFSQTIYVYAKSKVGPDYCTDESSFNVKLSSCDLPKGISPNGDGINEYLDLDTYGVTSLIVYNRYGKEVYAFKGNYTREWAGQDKSGNTLPDGTYFYNVVSHGEVKTGWIQINK